MYSSDNEDFGKFIKKPRFGQKIKVYPNVSNESARYGIVQFVKEIERREIVVLEEVFEEIPLFDCDYCLEKRRVEFLLDNDKLKNVIQTSKEKTERSMTNWEDIKKDVLKRK